MNFTSIKNLLLFLLIATISSCDSDDSSDLPTDGGTRLILKRTNTDNNLSSEFNTSGRHIRSTAGENPNFRVTIDHTFNNNEQRTKTTINSPSFKEITEFIYNNSGDIIETKKTEDNIGGLSEIITTFVYQGNQIIAKNNQNNESFQYIFTFSDNSYSELIRFKAINETSGETFFEESYSYHSSGNFKHGTIITTTSNQLPPDITFEYDNKNNPWSEGNRVDYLNEIFRFTYKNTGSLRTILVIFSKNNRLTSFIENNTITLEYNDQGYIIKEIDSSNDPDRDHIINFEYY